MTTSAETAWYRLQPEGVVLRVMVGGAWTRAEARRLDPLMRAMSARGFSRVDIDCTALSRLDTVGAWLLLRTGRRFESEGAQVRPTNVAAEYRALVHTIDHECRGPPVELPPPRGLRNLLEKLGRGLWYVLHQGHSLLGFFGLLVVHLGKILTHPRRLRMTALAHQMEETGLNALPIVGLLSLLIGIVIAYQGAGELHRFGADVLTVDLLSVAILRELGGMMAAIMVAGRSGSAFTAQIGTMKVNEELDAIEVGGLDVIEVLVLPRLLAIMVTLPLLTFYSNVMGLLGGALTCYFDLGITTPVFLNQVQVSVTGWTFWVGILKAPVFAFIIGMVGCHQGLKAERNASSVGRHTTQAVVQSIFLVIAADAIFSIVFSKLGI